MTLADPLLLPIMEFSIIFKKKNFEPFSKGRVQKQKKIWNFPDLVGGWVWKSPFSRFEKIKKCSQNALKCLNIHLKETYFCHVGVSVTDSGLPTTPHMLYIGRTMHCVGHTAHFVGRRVHCVAACIVSSIQSQHQVQNSVLAFSRVKK